MAPGKCKRFSGKADLKLLELVKENSLLYDSCHPKYSDSESREIVWKSIGETLQISAAEFAGIQCQIQFGDYNPEKHKPGFLRNLNEYLPEQYCSSWAIEKKVFKEFSKHVGLNELEAKHLYTKTARELPTYGITFFLVKEKQKGKKKLVPRLLGISAESILRLDETTKEVIQTWPLSHLKTYHAGKGETFTLNFGDYTDKEYSVKTRDAFRIRDILEGYIDLIRKRMLANYNLSTSEHGYVGQDNVCSGQASVMQHISNNPAKIVEQSFVGPSKIVQYQPGLTASQGTQMVTAQQMIINEMKNKQEHGVLKTEVSMRKDMGVPFTRRLNRLNSNSVKIVTLLTEPSPAHLGDAQKIVDEMNADMPCIRDGIRDTIDKQASDEERRKLVDQLAELDELMRTLTHYTQPESENPSEAEDAAKKIASLSTEMYFAIAPESRRRSRILSKTRTSFIADERTEKNLRRASFIAATATANHAVDSAAALAEEEYKGPPLTPSQIEELENGAVDKLGKLNAAIAHYLLAHSDPLNIDYSTAVNSLNTIHELMPDLARDAQALASVKDGKKRSELLKDINELCAAAKYVCSLSGVDDFGKLQEASSKYGDVSGRLVYLFGKRGGKARCDKENQLIDKAEAIGEKTSVLLNSAQALVRLSPSDAAVKDINDACDTTAVTAKNLIAQTVLNAPTISEPHCQSAVTAASEALSSSVQHLAATWKPLVEHPSRHVQGEQLHNLTMDLAKALDRLREAYGDSGDAQVSDIKSTAKPGSEELRLQFINSLAKVGGNWKAAEENLDKPLTTKVNVSETAAAERRLADRLAQLNAAVASLLAATTDRENPDYATAEAAIITINELMPELIQDSKVASANQDEASRKALLANIKELCAASKSVSASAYGADPEVRNDALVQFTDSSGRLNYVVNRRASPDRESQLIDATSAACAQAGALLSGVQQLSSVVGSEDGERLDAKGAIVADAARALFTTAQVTAPSISDPRCQSTLLGAVDKVSSTTDVLEQTWKPLAKDEKHAIRVKALGAARKQLNLQLDKIRALCSIAEEDIQSTQNVGREPQKLQFIATMRGVTDKLAEAHKELNKPATPAKGSNMETVQHRLDLGLEQLNAAIAALLAATADQNNPDCAAAEQSAEVISKLIPQLIKDTKTVSASKEESARAAMLSEIKALCEASEGICASAYSTDTKGLNDAVAKFSDASGKLVFVVNPRRKPQKKVEVVELAKTACKETSNLLPTVQMLAEELGGLNGQELDTQGRRLADAAQNLLQTAQVLSPSLQSHQCQEALLSSVTNLSTAGQQLAATVVPLQGDPKHGAKASHTLQALQRLESELKALRAACKSPEVIGTQVSQDQEKLQFIRTMKETKQKLAEAHKELNKPATLAKGSDIDAVRHRLDLGLEQLNAAIAKLLAATADHENPDCAVAEQAAATLSKLMPQLIKDTKTVSASKEESARAAMLSEIKALCEASEEICASAYGSDTKNLNEAVAKFSDASEKLVFVVNPRRNPHKKEKVVELARVACSEAAALLPTVQQLAEDVGGTRRQELDTRGGRVATAAQNLLQATQILNPSLQSPQCQEALLSSVASLSTAGQQLAASVAPLQADHKHGAAARHTLQALRQLDSELEGLRAACKAPEDLSSQDQQKLQFITSMKATKDKLAEAHKELSKPAMPAKGSDVEAVQQRLDLGLDQLNAAIATFLAATADHDNPDCATAEQTAETVAKLMPQLIKDTKTVSASKDESARAAMLSEIKALCEASEGICASAYGTDTKGLQDAVAKFNDASEKLVFVANPRRKLQKNEKVVELARVACSETAALLPTVQQLAEDVGGTRGQELDTRGRRVATAAQNLLQAAQILNSSLQSPQCQEALLSSVTTFSTAGQQLAATVAPLNGDHKYGAEARHALQALQRLDSELEALKVACKAPEVLSIQDQQKLQFITSMKDTKEKLAEAQKELSKPDTPAKGSDTDAVQHRLDLGLEQLNAAIATLLAATTDHDNPDCAAAKQSAETISKLMPQLIKDTKTVSASKEESARAEMLSEIKALCEASEEICASAYGTDTKGLNNAVAKFSDASEKLVFVVNPRKKPQKKEKVVELARVACSEAAALLPTVQKLAEDVGGTRGQELDTRGGRVATAAQNLLQAAQILSPSLQSPQCQEALLSSVDNLSTAGQQLAASVAPLQADHKHGAEARHTLQALKHLDSELEALRAACKSSGSQVSQEPQKLKFIKTLEATKGTWADIQKDLKKLVPPSRGGEEVGAQQRLCSRLGALDAALAALLAATADHDKPCYDEAEKSVKAITEMLPQIIQDTKTVSASKEESARAAMLSEIKALCEASEGICASAYSTDTKDVNEDVAKYSRASAKLVYEANPRLNRHREKEVLDQSKAACASTAALLAGAQQLAGAVGGTRGRDLDEQGGRLADAAQNLLQTAQITTASLSSPECRVALLTSADRMSGTADVLSRSLSPLTSDPAHATQARQLTAALQQLQAQLDRLKKTCNKPDTAPPPPSRKSTLIAHASPYKGPHTMITEEFLNRLRTEESMGNNPLSPLSSGPAVVGKVQKKPPPPPVRKTDDDKLLSTAFVKSLEDAEKSIKGHESSLMKQCRSPSGTGPALSHRDMMMKQVDLQKHLALAGVEVAALVTANYADKIDYSAASKSTKALPELMTSIVQEGTQLADNLNDMARKAFLYDMLQLCEAGRKICDAAHTDRQKMNDAAINFGDTSTKLLYVVSSDVDPTLEKEIISRAKAIGDSASHLALEAANIATAPSSATSSSVQEICDAGAACVDAAGKLVYTAKLTAPSIHEPACQGALVTSTETLSTKLKTFADSWTPLEKDPQQAKTIAHLSKEAVNLERILAGLRSDVKEGNIGRRRELEQLVVEDTPIRQLTVKILDEAKLHADSSSLPAQEKIAYAAYADKLSTALRALDLANARCKRTPHDTEKRRDLERAIQNLQMILLQSRPSRGEKGNTNIVDLMDFMEEVATEAKNLSSAAGSASVPAPQDMMTLEGIKMECEKIESKANKLLSGENASDLDFNDLFDQFGQECDDAINQLRADVKGMEDVKAKKVLQSGVMALSESCNMLRFATKSGISTEACCTLDASLDELDDIEGSVISSIVQDAAASGVKLRSKISSHSSHSPATINLCRQVTSSPTGVAPATVTAYIADVTSRTDVTNPEEKNKLLKHLYKLVHLLKTLTVTSSKRAATWQTVDGPETSHITEQILQEIYNPESKFGLKPDKVEHKILDENVVKLLIPSAPKILGDNKQQESKLNQMASQLSATCNSVSQGVSSGKSADMSRILSQQSRVAFAQARELDGIARGVHITDPIQKRKVDEAAKEMSFATYNVLKTAESVCMEPKNSNLKRRLADALGNLNNSIDKLVWHSSSAPVLQRQCGALSRGTAAQLAALQPRPSTAAPFTDTCDLMAKQGEQISKLKSDERMPRTEFMRNLDDIGTAVRTSVECAAQCAYYIAVSDQHKHIAKSGIVEVPQIQKAIESIQDSCMAIIGSSQIDQAKEQKEDLHKRVSDFAAAMDKAQMLVKSGDARKALLRAKSCISDAADDLESDLESLGDMEQVTPKAVNLLEAVNSAHIMIEQCPLVPAVGEMTTETRVKCDEVMNQSKSLLSHTLALLDDVNAAPEDPEMLTWVTFNTNRKKLLDAYDALLKTVRRNGHRAGIYEKAPEEEEKEKTKKSYVETQVELANKWLKSPSCKTEVKVIGQQAVRNIVDMARQMSEDLKGPEREELRSVVTETEELLSECSKNYNHEKNSVLMERLKELRKCIRRGVVTRVVEDFIEAEAPLADLDLLADIEQDETKRKFILERKIASLLAQLGRVTKTARFVANASQDQGINVELTQCSEQTELLAPMLVKAAQQRIDHPDDNSVIEKYKALLAQYAESVSKVRDLCDRAVDPMDFVQTAGDTMQRMREDMTQHNSDPQKCAFASSAITKLANRVINVSMSSNAVASDPELQKSLIAAKQRLHAVTPAPNTRASRLPDWRDTTAEILRTTGDVESALGGENIFKKEPTTANQPIYSVARSLHESVREWSSRDNEIVGVARRMAVLMARLSEYMATDKKDALIVTSKSIVAESQEVSELAKKLAHECTDVRIKTNLLQTCERIPTVSGQLKMLTTVKASSLGQQGVEEDKEAMDMLVGNAESLMMSVSDVVKAAASASVKIMSQRGPRLRWVRKNYY